MCDPTTLLVASAGLNLAGGVAGAQAKSQQARAQAQEDELQARFARDSAEAEAARIRRAGETVRGAAVATQAGSGVRVGEGSALEAERQIVTDFETDASIALLTGQRQGSALERQAGLRRRAGRAARNEGLLNVGGSLLSTGSRLSRIS